MGAPTQQIQVKEIVKQYALGRRAVPALRGVSFGVPAGAFCAVTGPSGSGKSTLLNIIGLLDTADSGSVEIEGHNVGSLSTRQAARMRRTRIGFVFQEYNLIPVLTAYENVELPLVEAKAPAGVRGRHEWIMHLLQTVGLAEHAHHRPGELSGGQQQRVAIARALVNRPAVVLADEPTANLDSQTGAQIIDLMRTFRTRFGTTCIFSTHDPAIRSMADTTISLLDGVVVS